MTLKLVLLTALLIAFTTISFGQTSIRLLSQTDSLPIPFALLIQKSEGKGVGSDKDGYIRLPQEALSSDFDFIISALGFEDMKINAKSITNGRDFYLVPKIFDLAPYTINAQKLKPSYLGDTLLAIDSDAQKLDLLKEDGKNKRNSVNFSYSAYLNFKDKKDRYISGIWVFFRGLGDDDVFIRFRWMVSEHNKNPKAARYYPSSEFFDLARPSSVYKINKNKSWNQFNLLNDEIFLPKNLPGCFLIIDVIPNEYGRIANIYIPFQESKGNQISPAFYTGSNGAIGILDDKDSFAIMVEYLK